MGSELTWFHLLTLEQPKQNVISQLWAAAQQQNK
jgi:hypothetical protein